MLRTLINRASRVAVGTAIGQGAVLAITPYLARHYSPEEFGALALLSTVSNISVAAACLRYDLAIPSSAKAYTRGLLITALICAGVMAFLSCALLKLFATLGFFHYAGNLIQYPVLVGVCVLFVGFYQAVSAQFLHRGAFNAVAYMRLSQGIGFSVLAVIPGLGLLWAHVLSFAGGLSSLRRVIGPAAANESPWREAAYSYRQFPLLSLPGALLDVCGYSLCIWVITSFYGQGMAGNYSQIQRLTGAPLMLLSISVGQILLKQTAELSHDLGALRQFFAKILKLMAALAAAALLFLWLFGEPILHYLLGPRWKVDHDFITLVAVAVFVRACVSPLSTILITLHRLGLGLTWQALYFCSALILMPYVAARINFDQYMIFYALHECFFYGLSLIFIYRAISLGKSDRGRLSEQRL